MNTNNIDLILLKNIAREAGAAIMDIYSREDFKSITDFKADNSPLTLADQVSHKIIQNGLEKAYPEIPVLSEEGKNIPYEERKDWKTFWLVDPLDGTKEFIKRNGEFTVNIALITGDEAVAGVIYAPARGIMYSGIKGKGAWKESNDAVEKMTSSSKSDNLTAVGSRSHSSPEEEELLNSYNVSEAISIGSSLKFCLVAEGKADIYYRHGPTMEWDTAAGQAIVEAAGGIVVDQKKNRFAYNKQSLLNGSFLCLGNKPLLK